MRRVAARLAGRCGRRPIICASPPVPCRVSRQSTFAIPAAQCTNEHRWKTRLSYNSKEGKVADYSIWVLEYAAVEKFPRSVMLYGPMHQGEKKLPYGFVVLKGRGETIL